MRALIKFSQETLNAEPVSALHVCCAGSNKVHVQGIIILFYDLILRLE